MQGLDQIIRQNEEAVRRFKDSNNKQLKEVAQLAEQSNKVIAGKQVPPVSA